MWAYANAVMKLRTKSRLLRSALSDPARGLQPLTTSDAAVRFFLLPFQPCRVFKILFHCLSSLSDAVLQNAHFASSLINGETLTDLGMFNPLNPELNPICYLLALLAHHFLHVSRLRVKSLTFRLLMSYIYMEHLFLMFLDHTQRRTTVGRTPLDE